MTPGPWGLRGFQIRADSGSGAHVATYQIDRSDGLAIAALPELIEMLQCACECLDASERGSATHSTADSIRARLEKLGITSADRSQSDNSPTDPDPSNSPTDPPSNRD